MGLFFEFGMFKKLLTLENERNLLKKIGKSGRAAVDFILHWTKRLFTILLSIVKAL